MPTAARIRLGRDLLRHAAIVAAGAADEIARSTHPAAKPSLLGKPPAKA